MANGRKSPRHVFASFINLQKDMGDEHTSETSSTGSSTNDAAKADDEQKIQHHGYERVKYSKSRERRVAALSSSGVFVKQLSTVD